MKPVIVVGQGEVGRPLFEIISEHYADAVSVDIQPVEVEGGASIMHICYPFEIPDFVGTTVAYIEKYRPELTIINSTIAPGTTRAVHQATGAAIAYSPVRGKHARMKQEMLKYVKFIGPIDAAAGQRAAEHFQTLGMQTKVLAAPETAELAKLTETTYFGLLIAWAQEVERYCDQVGANYDEVASFYEEIGYLPPVKYTPGVIGGHCVMPNIKILKSVFHSELLDSIEDSNQEKCERAAVHVGESQAVRGAA
jgi:UDP-N-acetyl-D-mannosaminuronate dehydrogenase